MSSEASCCHNGDDRDSSSDLPAPEQRPLGSILPEEIRQVNPNETLTAHPDSGVQY